MTEAAFSNCSAEDYISTDKDVQTEPDTMNIHALVQNFREGRKGRQDEEKEEENDTVTEEEKCSVKTYQDADKSLKELQEFAVQRNDSDMLSTISQAKVFVETQAAKSKLRAKNGVGSILEILPKFFCVKTSRCM
jgi:uncharacterized surface protein with fasciclin (FAS1) repeats